MGKMEKKQLTAVFRGQDPTANDDYGGEANAMQRSEVFAVSLPALPHTPDFRESRPKSVADGCLLPGLLRRQKHTHTGRQM